MSILHETTPTCDRSAGAIHGIHEARSESPARPLRIGVFFAARGGGAQLVMVNLANELYRMGQQVDVVMPELTGPYITELAPGIRQVGFGTRKPLRVANQFSRYLRDSIPDVILAGQQQTNVAAVLAHRWIRSSSKLVLVQHNQLSVLTANDRRLLVRSLPWCVRHLYRRADRVVAVSEGVADDLSRITRMSREDLDVIHNPVIDDRVRMLGNASPEHPWMNDGRGDVLVSAGRLTKQKDYPTLLHAMERVRERSNTRLIILGGGDEHDSLKAMVARMGLQDAVALPGMVSNPYCYMARAAAFVLSSAWEGFGNVIAEAMSFGTPVVSTDCPSGPSEILMKGRYGRLVPVGDAQAMGDAILATLNESPDTASLRSRANDFTTDSIAKRYLQLLREVCV